MLFFHPPQGINLVRNTSAITANPANSHRFCIHTANNTYTTAHVLNCIHCDLENFFILPCYY
ncbi:hypothetical protein Barb7_01877 [Bacteroidales bacterium Barb7]|nr:hypothetical protein Barb7_01877 [Bacteroidales bacterium Barb7]